MSQKRIDFTDQNGDSWMEYPIVHPKFKVWWNVYRKQYAEDIYLKDLEDLTKEQLDQVFKHSPWYGSTANDIDWVKRVEIQGVIQNYTTHSISSTINLPSTATVEEVSNIYLEAHKHGLKGVTVYRDGCRTGVLVSSTPTEKEVKFTEHDAPKRPTSLPCKLVRFQNNYEKWVAFIGLLDGRPYEIFTGPLKSFPLPNSVEEGFIVKNKTDSGKEYDFHYTFDGGQFVMKRLSEAFNSEYWNYAKLISSMLRHGMPIFYVAQTVEDMTFDKDHINVWKYGVVRALKKFIANGTSYKQKCLECGSENVVFEEGCSVCKSCGSSKCG